MATITVGAAGDYATIALAYAAANDGDTLSIIDAYLDNTIGDTFNRAITVTIKAATGWVQLNYTDVGSSSRIANTISAAGYVTFERIRFNCPGVGYSAGTSYYGNQYNYAYCIYLTHADAKLCLKNCTNKVNGKYVGFRSYMIYVAAGNSVELINNDLAIEESTYVVYGSLLGFDSTHQNVTINGGRYEFSNINSSGVIIPTTNAVAINNLYVLGQTFIKSNAKFTTTSTAVKYMQIYPNMQIIGPSKYNPIIFDDAAIHSGAEITDASGALLWGARSTTITNDETDVSTSFEIASTTGYASGMYFMVDTEIIKVTAVPNSTTLTVSRAAGGTTAAAHSAGATIAQCYPAGETIYYDGSAVVAGTEYDSGIAYISTALCITTDVPSVSANWSPTLQYCTGKIQNVRCQKDAYVSGSSHGIFLGIGVHDFVLENIIGYNHWYECVIKSPRNIIKNCAFKGYWPVSITAGEGNTVENCTLIATVASTEALGISAQGTGKRMAENTIVKNNILAVIGAPSNTYCFGDRNRGGENNYYGTLFTNNVYYSDTAILTRQGTSVFASDAAGFANFKTDTANYAARAEDGIMQNPTFLGSALQRWNDFFVTDSTVLALTTPVGAMAGETSYPRYKKNILFYSADQTDNINAVTNYVKGKWGT